MEEKEIKQRKDLDKRIEKALDNFGKEWEEEIKYLTGFNRSIVGLSSDHRVVYSKDKMITQLLEDGDCEDEIDAIDYLDYNTVRALPYMGEGAPIIIDTSIEDLLNFYDCEED